MTSTQLSLQPVLNSAPRIFTLMIKILSSTVVGVKTDATISQNVIRNYGTRSRNLNCSLDSLRKWEETNRFKLVSSMESKGLESWAIVHCNVEVDNGLSYTEHELQ